MQKESRVDAALPVFQANQIVDEGKFFFIKELQLINEGISNQKITILQSHGSR